MVLSARLEAGLARFRAAFAATASLTAEVMAAPSRRQAAKPSGRRQRSRDAMSPPLPSRQYMRTISTRLLRDRRLTPNAVRLAGLIVALAGRRGDVDTTKRRLGAALGLCARTIGRLLTELRRYGYVATERLVNAIGGDAGLRILPLDALLPYFAQGIEGRTNETPPLRTLFQESPSRGKGLAGPIAEGRARSGGRRSASRHRVQCRPC